MNLPAFVMSEYIPSTIAIEGLFHSSSRKPAYLLKPFGKNERFTVSSRLFCLLQRSHYKIATSRSILLVCAVYI